MVNYYQELELSPNATQDEIRKAIHRELRIWTNRTNHAKLERRQEAERKVKILDEAEEYLLNAARRSEYDQKLQASPSKPKKMAETDIDEGEDLVQLGWQMLIDGRIADAVYVAGRATRQNPDNAEAWALSGQAKFRWGEDQDAIEDYRQATKLLPTEAEYYFDLGTIYESNERFSEALKQYQRAGQIEPETTMYKAAIGVLMIRAEEYDEGLRILRECVAKEPDNATYQYFMAIGYTESAYLGWTAVDEGHPHVPPGWYATDLQQVTQAQEKLEKARALKFDDPELRSALDGVKENIDSMNKRKIMANWMPPAIFAGIGLLMMGSDAGAGFMLVVIATLYVVSTLTPQYKVNARTIKGKVYSEFAWLTDMFGESTGCIGVVLLYGVILVLMPFVTVYNFVRNFAMK